VKRSALPLAALLGAALAAGCSTSKPVLYPDAHLQRVGAAQAEEDVAGCIALANSYGLGSGESERVARDSATGAATGGAGGAAAGAVVGRPGTGAAAGAAGGAASGLVRGLFRRDPDPLHRRFVERCLRERGYSVIGWR